MKKKKITIAITGLNNTDNPGPGIPVIRGIRDSEFFEPRIIGFAYENLEPGIYMHDLVDKTYLLPYPSEGTTAVLDRLKYIRSVENINVLIPNFDAELYSFIKLNPQLDEMGIKTFLPGLEQFEERQKSNLPEFGKKYDVKVPSSKNITNIADINSLKEDFDFPVLVKGKFYDAYIAQNPEQVMIYFNKINARWGLPVIIQEYIRGTEVNVVALGDGTGRTVGAVPMRKQYITDKGKAWGGITLDAPDMIELTHRLINATKWKGGMELELIRDDKNELYLIEINPRIPAWVYLAVGAGQNIPEALVKLALGIPVPSYTDFRKGIIFIRYSFDMICNREEFEKLTSTGEL